MQPDIIGLKLILMNEPACIWLVSMESVYKSRRNKGKGSDMYMGDQG